MQHKQTSAGFLLFISRLFDAVSLDHDILRLQRRRRGVRLLLHDHLHGRLHGVLGAAGGGKQASLLLQEGPAKSTSRYAIDDIIHVPHVS